MEGKNENRREKVKRKLTKEVKTPGKGVDNILKPGTGEKRRRKKMKVVKKFRK